MMLVAVCVVTVCVVTVCVVAVWRGGCVLVAVRWWLCVGEGATACVVLLVVFVVGIIVVGYNHRIQ